MMVFGWRVPRGFFYRLGIAISEFSRGRRVIPKGLNPDKGIYGRELHLNYTTTLRCCDVENH